MKKIFLPLTYKNIERGEISQKINQERIILTSFVTAETVSPGHPDKIADLISDYVLTNFSDEEKVNLEKIIQNIINAIPILIDKKLNRKSEPNTVFIFR